MLTNMHWMRKLNIIRLRNLMLFGWGRKCSPKQLEHLRKSKAELLWINIIQASKGRAINMFARRALTVRIRDSSKLIMGWKLIFNCVCNISFTLWVRGWEKLIECNDKFFSFLAPCTLCNHLDVSCTSVSIFWGSVGWKAVCRHRHIASLLKLSVCSSFKAPLLVKQS